MAGNTTQSHVYVWFSDDGTNMVPVTLADPFPVTVISGGGANASVGLTGSTAPTSATEIGWINGSGNLVGVSAGNPLPVSGTVTASNPSVSGTGAAVPASATYLGASVAGNLTGLVATANGLKVDGTATIQPVSGTVSIGAGSAVIGHVITDTSSTTAVTQATAANLNATVIGTVTANAGTNLNTSLLAVESGGNLATLAGGVTSSVYQENIKQVNGVTVLTGTGATGTGCQRVTVAVDSATVAGSASLPAGSNVIGHVINDASSAVIGHVITDTNSVTSASNFPTTVDTNSGNKSASTLRTLIATDALAVPTWGHGATAATAPSGATYQGARGTTANPSAVTDGQLVGTMADKVGRQVTVPYAARDLVAQQTTTITSSTGETTVVTAVSATFLDILSFNFSNSGATATRVDIRDDTAGTVRAVFYVPAGDMRGQTYTVPFTQTATNKNWTAQCSASTASLYVTVQYVKNI